MRPRHCKSIIIAVILSLLIPGTGHIYLGRIGRGFATFIIASVLIGVTLGLAYMVIAPLVALEAAIMSRSVGECPICRARIHAKALRCPMCGESFA